MCQPLLFLIITAVSRGASRWKLCAVVCILNHYSSCCSVLGLVSPTAHPPNELVVLRVSEVQCSSDSRTALAAEFMAVDMPLKGDSAVPALQRWIRPPHRGRHGM